MDRDRQNCDDSRGSGNAVERGGFVEGQGWSTQILVAVFLFTRLSKKKLFPPDIAQSPRFILAYMSHPKRGPIHYSESGNLSGTGRVKNEEECTRSDAIARGKLYFFPFRYAK